jgi:hypothetical protein
MHGRTVRGLSYQRLGLYTCPAARDGNPSRRGLPGVLGIHRLAGLLLPKLQISIASWADSFIKTNAAFSPVFIGEIGLLRSAFSEKTAKSSKCLGRMDRGLGNAGGLGCRSRIMMDATSNIVRKFQAVLSFGVATGWCC